MRRHRSDRLIGVLTVFLMGLGLIVIYAIGPMRVNVLNSAYGANYSEQYFFVHQAISVGLALAAFIFAFKFPYEKIRKFAKWLVLIGLGLCAVMWILSWVHVGIVNCQLGACRWFSFGSLSVQPAEVLKLGLVLYLAQLVATRKQEGKLDTWNTDFWLPFSVICGLSLFFVVIAQKDLGTGVSMLAIILAILFMGGIPMKKFLIVLGIVGVAGILAIVSSPHRLERLMTYGGDSDSDSSYHIENAMIAIGTGGMFGVGIGNSVQATGYLPESINDSVFAVMGETFGFIGLMIIVLCFMFLLLRLLKTASGLPTEESLVVIGVFAWVMAHMVVNIMAMTGLIPLTGITLPLLSYGGTSLVIMVAALGLCLQLSCYTGREVRNENISSGRRLRGTHNPSRSRNS